MQQWLFVLGAIPLLILGTLHIAYTLIDAFKPSKIVPANRDLIAQMKETKLRLTKQTDMWRAWMGFNFSHGLGVIAISGFYLYMALCQFDALIGIPVLVYAAPVLAGIYAILAKLYWFRVPFIGSSLSTVLFLAAVLLPVAGGA